ncbi:unnamed protein product [Closterium sp. NIES-53]
MLTPPRDTLLAASERTCSAGSPTWSHVTPEESVQDSAGTPPTTTSAPGSPWALASSAEGMQTCEIGGPTLPDHKEQGGDVMERTGLTGPRHPRQRSQFPQAADELSAPGIPQGYGAGAQREERLEQREEQIARTTPHGENVEPRTDIHTHGEQANADERSGERENGGDTSGGHGNGSVTPRVEVNEVTAVIAATAAAVRQRDDRRGGSPAYRRGPPMNDGEANAPGAPQPLRQSARRTPHAQAPPEARIRLSAEPVPAADPQSADGSHPHTPAEQQVRSRQDLQEEADRKQDQPLRRSHGPEHQGSPLASAQGAPLARDKPITPISQAQQAAPVAATPRSGPGSTRGRGGR